MGTRQELTSLLRVQEPSAVESTECDRRDCGSYERLLVTYTGDESEQIPAYLLVPKTSDPCPGVVVFHQHNGQWHLGKSEVVGLLGDPFQAFGPALVERGIAVLAPDALTFEDRRAHATEHGA